MLVIPPICRLRDETDWAGIVYAVADGINANEKPLGEVLFLRSNTLGATSITATEVTPFWIVMPPTIGMNSRL